MRQIEDEEKNNYDCGLRDVLCWIIWRLWTVRDEADNTAISNGEEGKQEGTTEEKEEFCFS